jgi:hypothetical protein
VRACESHAFSSVYHYSALRQKSGSAVRFLGGRLPSVAAAPICVECEMRQVTRDRACTLAHTAQHAHTHIAATRPHRSRRTGHRRQRFGCGAVSLLGLRAHDMSSRHVTRGWAACVRVWRGRMPWRTSCRTPSTRTRRSPDPTRPQTSALACEHTLTHAHSDAHTSTTPHVDARLQVLLLLQQALLFLPLRLLLLLFAALHHLS